MELFPTEPGRGLTFLPQTVTLKLSELEYKMNVFAFSKAVLLKLERASESPEYLIKYRL